MSAFRCLLCCLLWAAYACEPSGKPGEPAQAQPAMQAEVVAAGPGPVTELVAQAQRAAAKEGRRLVVYVGASWCEPCEYFLEAIESKALPEKLADLRFLKFDNDADEERLNKAGFGGQMIPRFVVPGEGGAASPHRFEGSIKGPEAVGNIVPRLEAILAPAS